MKFYGNGVVWDKENNKVLCRFINGELETSDTNIINKLDILGYENDGNYPVIEDKEPEQELKQEKQPEETEQKQEEDKEPEEPEKKTPIIKETKEVEEIEPTKNNRTTRRNK